MSRVLVVDDMDVITHLLSVLLERGNLTPVEVPPKHIKELLSPDSSYWNDVDVIICDISMPGVDGRDILSVAKKYFPNILRVVLTGWYAGSDIAQDLYEYADIVKYKPDDVVDIVRLIQERLGRQ